MGEVFRGAFRMVKIATNISKSTRMHAQDETYPRFYLPHLVTTDVLPNDWLDSAFLEPWSTTITPTALP